MHLPVSIYKRLCETYVINKGNGSINIFRERVRETGRLTDSFYCWVITEMRLILDAEVLQAWGSKQIGLIYFSVIDIHFNYFFNHCPTMTEWTEETNYIFFRIYLRANNDFQILDSIFVSRIIIFKWIFLMDSISYYHKRYF